MPRTHRLVQLALAVLGAALFAIGAVTSHPVSTLLGGCVGFCIIAIIGVRGLA